MMKIAISAPGFYGIDKALKEAFEAEGHQVYLYNNRTRMSYPEKAANVAGKFAPFAKSAFNTVIYRYLLNENESFIAFLKHIQPDLVFIVKGEYLLPKTLERIRKELSTPIVSYIWDDPFYSYAGKYVDDFRRMNFEHGMGLYDHIFVYDPYYVRAIKDRGIAGVSYLPLAADPKRYYPREVSADDRKAFGYDLCFVGFPFPNRVKVLDSIQGHSLGVFGDGWNRLVLSTMGKMSIPKYWKGKASGDKVLSIYRSSKIVLNIHDPEAQEGLNTRTFDILACGAFELVDHKKCLEDHFSIGDEIVSFKSINELPRLIDYYLGKPDLIQAIADNGRNRILAEHTWQHRVKYVFQVLRERGIFNSMP